MNTPEPTDEVQANDFNARRPMSERPLGSVFRAQNELIHAGLLELLGGKNNADEADMYRFMCECASFQCEEMLDLTLPEYRHARSNDRWWVISPGHADADVDAPAGANDRFWLV
ncbi:MAG: hypothetical protein H7123_06135 [Thermoleophilia bacterium]|nr:hypothetical protein [Thermoleophilia bacterium]